MKRKFTALAVGGLLAYALTFSAEPAAAQFGAGAGGHDPRVSAARRGPPPNVQRAPIPRGPMVNPNIGAPRVYRGPVGGGISPSYRGPVVPRGPLGVVGPAYRGPAAPGYRGPVAGFRGPARATYFRGRNVTFVRGPYRVRRGGYVLPLVGLGVLGGIYVGSRQYTPYAYVDGVVGPDCAGPTDDGVCELRMTEVPLEGGGAELQCVAYCPPQ